MRIAKIKEWIEQKPIIAYPVIGLGVLLTWSLLAMSTTSKISKSESKGLIQENSKIGLEVGRMDEHAYIARLEKNYYDFEDRVKTVEDHVKKFNVNLGEISKSQKELSKSIKKIDKHMADLINEHIAALQPASNSDLNQAMELAIAHIKPLQEKDNFVYLPIGSFCKGTLLTGVYAAADANNPLPVLISLDEAFYGPNKTRVPLKGSFILGKAIGDIVSERALIQIVAISSVLPNGQAFEHEENLGYVTDEAGELGIRGEVIRNTGKALALSFMGGFLTGGSQAVADGEMTTSETRSGGVRNDVTGDTSKHAIFSGLAKSAGRMSDYYEKQAENLVPAVHIPSGRSVYFIVQKGVRIDGLLRTDNVPIAVLN